eukprot:3452967-Rhodomonas_salina.1
METSAGRILVIPDFPTICPSGGGSWNQFQSVITPEGVTVFINGAPAQVTWWGATPSFNLLPTWPGFDIWVGNNPGGARPFDGWIDNLQVAFTEDQCSNGQNNCDEHANCIEDLANGGCCDDPDSD